MCQKISLIMYNKTRHRNGNCVSWLWWLTSIPLACLSFMLIIHSVNSQIIHNDNIAQESSDSTLQVQVRMLDGTDDQYSYLTGKDLMADETEYKDR